MNYAELEIGLHRRDTHSYAVELRFSHPDLEADIRLIRDGAATLELDSDALGDANSEPDVYAHSLTEQFFADQELRDAFRTVRMTAQKMAALIRLRLYIGPTAPELHNIHWELLRDPHDQIPLSISEEILFSRYLMSFDWQPIRLRSMADLRALAVVASPVGLKKYGLADVDVDRELGRARSGLEGIATREIVGKGEATLDGILGVIRDEGRLETGVADQSTGIDILYLVCHGSFVRGEPWLWLEDSDGEIDRVAGKDLSSRMQALPEMPRVAILISCQSGGGPHGHTADHGALSALGPRLAQIGVSTVIAMQGNVSVATIDKFIPIFFDELREDGQIDRALAVARGSIRDRADWWMPVLFTRLRAGRIWYVPGFGDEKDARRKLPALVRNIQYKQCTPILGPGVIETLVGTQRDMARRWAATYNFPLEPHSRDDLPQVAQYLTIAQDFAFPRYELPEYVRQSIVMRFRHSALADWNEVQCQEKPMQELIRTVGNYIWDKNPEDPTLTMAGWPVPIYINTMPDSFLLEALRRVGKRPKVEICRWNSYLESEPPIFELYPDYEPSPEEPLVFHIFGYFEDRDSMVLTEDDYFDYLIGSTRNSDLIPSKVREVLVNSALLFLGFYIEDWNFRVLFRSIMGLEGSDMLSKYAHVAAQIAPSEGRLIDSRRAQEYLQDAFLSEKVSIYWGNIREFTSQLQENLSKRRVR